MSATLSYARRGVLVALCAIATPLGAQDRSSAPEWARLRVDSGAPLRVVTLSGEIVEGRLTSQTTSAVTLRLASSDTMISTRDIDVVDAEVGHRKVLSGLGVGVLSGVLAGVVVGVASSAGCHGEFCGIDLIIAPPALGLLGGVLGAIAGATHETRAWERVNTGPR